MAQYPTGTYYAHPDGFYHVMLVNGASQSTDISWNGSVVPPPPPPPPPPNPLRYEGADAVKFEDLYTTGNGLYDVAVKVQQRNLGEVLTAPAGSFKWSDFSQANGQAGLVWPTGIRGQSGFGGFAGSGIGQTIIGMTPMTSTKAGSVPADSHRADSPVPTNQLDCMRTNSSTGHLYQQFTFEMLDEGHLYNGWKFTNTTNCIMNDVLVKGGAGDEDTPPGETFDINMYQSTGFVGTRIEVDGRRDDGISYAASPFGYNSASGGSLTDCYFHDCHASTFAFWQSHDIVTTNTKSWNNGSNLNAHSSAHGINHERSYNIKHINPDILLGNLTNGNSGYHMSMNSDTGDGLLTVINPIYHPDQLAGRYSAAYPTQFIVMSFASYRGQTEKIVTKPAVLKSDGVTPFTPYLWAH